MSHFSKEIHDSGYIKKVSTILVLDIGHIQKTSKYFLFLSYVIVITKTEKDEIIHIKNIILFA